MSVQKRRVSSFEKQLKARLLPYVSSHEGCPRSPIIKFLSVGQ